MKSRVAVSCVIKKDDKYLLGKKKDGIGPYPDMWHLIGGGVNLEDETTEEGIVREIREETGIEVTNLKRLIFQEDNEPNKKGEMVHFIFLIFTADYLSGTPKAGDDIVELKWFTKSELKTISLPRPSVELFTSMKVL